MTRAVLAALLLAAAPALAQREMLDAAGRYVVVPAKVERVYAAGPPASILVYAINPDKLLGWTRALRADEAAFFPDKYARLPELGRLTGRGNTANVEVLLKARPDLVVDVGATAAVFASLADRVQHQTGVPYLLLDGRFEAIPDTLRALGHALGDAAAAERLAEYCERALREVAARVAQVPPEKRPRAYYGRGPQGLQTALGGSINAQVMEFLGARNVAGAARGGLAVVSLEQVLAWDPEVIFTNDPNFYEHVWRDARWGALAAVRAKRVHLAPHLPFGWFDFPPGPNRIIGLYWAGKILYPELFPEDLRAKTAEFYKLFHHRAPSAAQLDQLLGEPGVLPR
ncbi:MAG: iron ABC transporter substrate-binding protein [Betaproteobacteria bacterium]|nr:iron ABC transporter substrate-binding protein [Betaproteobacteria bacterium]MDH4325589.1 iron ABC transporter substrate-binding protein [Betaproteobacteria bacterium]MDH5577069.1 iron ABC transporter substrate-binding protein [Betaproteobacteria bacterium]